jgi:Na+-transporting methylmalonyl-CoA/oxaloacetate decarboxylase gamma subunit
MYYLIPALFGQKQMYSVKAIEVHFWTATIGIVIYIAAMWIAGVMQGLMWRAINADGTLTYTFVESVKATFPFYVIASVGWLAVPGRHDCHAVERTENGDGRTCGECQRHSCCSARLKGDYNGKQQRNSGFSHEKIETNNFLMIVLILLVLLVGGMVEIVPLFFQKSTTEPIKGVQPYTACSWLAVTFTSAKAATTAIRR